MSRPKSTVPTPGEIEILHVFWQHGARTVREVHDQLVKNRRVAYTTTASMVQLMHEKGLLALKVPVRPWRYEAAISQDDASDILINDIKNRLFGGSVKKMMLHMAASTKASKQRLQQLDKVLDGLA